MQFFENIIRPYELDLILSPSVDQDTISVGNVSDYDPEKVKRLLELWCERVDKIVELDIEIHGQPSDKARQLMHHRAFTYFEYLDLLNHHIQEHEFPYYPIFNQVRRSRGGINTEKQRYTFTSRYTNEQEDYLKLLLEEGHDSMLKFFFGELGKLSALLPLKKIRQHTLVVAPSGTGKSELLRVLFFRLQKKYPKFTMIMIDPHGDLALTIKNSSLTYEQRERLIYFDPFLADGYTPTFNPLDIGDRSDKNLGHTAEQIILAFEEILTREGGKPTENMINVLEKALYFLLQRPDSTISSLVEFFSANSPYAQEAEEYDPIFDAHFFKPGNRTRDGLHSRISRMINNPVLKRVFGGQSTFNLEWAMNSGKIIVFNLAAFGEMSQVTFGKFLVASIKSYIRKRKKNTGVPVICFVDEAHQLVSGSFEYILAQLRGFGLSMVMATQFIKQLGDQVMDVKKNTAIKIVGGDVEDDVKEVLKVDKDLRLKDYEFLLKVRNEKQTVFKSPSFMIKNPKKYVISEEQESHIDRMQLDRYYKVIGQENFQHRISPKQAPSEPKESNLPNPPFDLFLGDND